MSDLVVGTSPNRFGGLERVTGNQEYLADIAMPEALHVKLVTLDCARARILDIDTAAALEVPGARFVMTPDDLPHPMPRFGPQLQDRPLLAVGETKFYGEPVAAVAAETREAAEEAAHLVVVEHEVLEGGVFSVADAMVPDAVLVQDPSMRPGDPLAHTNVLREHNFGWGDVAAAAGEADLVVENDYYFPMMTHFAIEPHGSMVALDGDGIIVWSTIQHPFMLQKILSKVLGLPLSKVRVIAPDPGGGFGGKQMPRYEPLLIFMALKAQRPVRLVLTLDETFKTVRRVSANIKVRTGFMSDGTLMFEDFESDLLIGAYADIGDRVVSKSTYLSAGPYRVPAVRIRGRSILSHTVPATAFRGFGIPHVSWARESNFDEAARKLGIDRLDIRLQNLARFREEFVPGDTPADGDWEQTVREAAEMIGWGEPLPAGRGRGLAIGLKSGPTTGLSYSTVRLLFDGSVILYSGTSDMGQGARTLFAQIVADELGVPLEAISVVMGDTAAVPYDQQTSASRSSVLMGTAVLRACHDLHARVREMAARHYGLEESEITVEQGGVRLPDDELSIVEVVQASLGRLGGEVVGNGEMRKDADPDHPLGGTAAFFEFNCTASEVEVDSGTGEITLLNHVTVGDTGLSVNPVQVTGQDEGAAIMGIGHALMEHIILDGEGRIRNVGAIDYRIPTSKDLPLEMHSAAVENADGPGPYGIKGISEGALLAVAPAIGAAVFDATGAVIRDLPLSPERVWRAMRERDNE